jgi:hypothetical protein
VPFFLLSLTLLLASSPIVPTPSPTPSPVLRQTRLLPDSTGVTPRRADSVLRATLADGALYRRVLTSTGAVLHVLEIDTRRGLRIEAVKAADSYDGLETLGQLYERAERDARRDGDTVLAAINAGPWHPQLLSPVGPLVVNGQIVELGGDDAWSSLLLYLGGGAAITRDRIAGELIWRHRTLDIRSVNRRANNEAVVLYNRYYGDFAPAVGTRSDAEIVVDAIASRDADDTGIDFEEEELDTAAIVGAYRSARSRGERERAARKMAVRRLPTARSTWFGEPRINDTMWTVVTMVDTGTVPIPHDGYVLSFGSSEELMKSAGPGDTVRLIFQIARNGLGVVRDVVPGYPQLLFGGMPADEPEFVQGPAASVRPGEPGARTAVGISADGAIIYLVAVEAPTAARSGGMTIEELSKTMKSIGAHNAVALEGRSSTTMVVNYDAVTHGSGAAQRRISSGLIVKKKRRW